MKTTRTIRFAALLGLAFTGCTSRTVAPDLSISIPDMATATKGQELPKVVKADGLRPLWTGRPGQLPPGELHCPTRTYPGVQGSPERPIGIGDHVSAQNHLNETRAQMAAPIEGWDGTWAIIQGSHIAGMVAIYCIPQQPTYDCPRNTASIQYIVDAEGRVRVVCVPPKWPTFY